MAGGWPRVTLLVLAGMGLCGSALKPLCRQRFANSTDPWRDCRVQIGGLAIQGADAFRAALGPTFEAYLTTALNASHGLEFEALPLNFNQNFEYVGGQLVDYIYSNPSAYTCMMVEFNVATIASLVNFRAGNALDKFAGVIFSRVESNFSSIQDLKQAHVAAVSISGLGAMQLQQAELLKTGLNIMTDVRRLTFTKNQNLIVQEVQHGWADVGFVRTDMIERSVAANRTRWEHFKVIHEVPDSSFPFARSTAFTPEWPIGALRHVPPAVSELVSFALMQLDRNSPDPILSQPAILGSFATWVPPMNYLELLGMLEDITYLDAASRSCLRADDVLEAVHCPAGWVKQRPEQAFCPASECKPGYQCLCKPCVKLKDPELVLRATVVPTAWNPDIDAAEVNRSTLIASSCSRMSRCASVAVGQRLTLTLLDQVGDANRQQINAERIASVEMLTNLDGSWRAAQRENITIDGSATEQYVLDVTVQAAGMEVMQIRINGNQAAMSPVVVEGFLPPEQRVFCPEGHRLEANGSCSICPAGSKGDLILSDRTGLLIHVCSLCELGKYQGQPGQSTCLSCSVGTVASVEGSTNCTACPAGSSTQNKEGSASCIPCRPGMESRLVGNASRVAICSECMAGRYSSEEGSHECIPCPVGSIASAAGSVRCLPCTPGSVASEPGSAQCRPCARGRYAPGNTSNCQACGQGMTTAEIGAENASFCACPSDTFMRPGHGCVPCEEGLECAGGNGMPLQAPGYWAEVLDEEARLYSVYACRDSLECPGGPLGSCAEGRQGKACNNCKDEYRGTDAGECQPCAASDLLPFFAAGCGLMIALVVLMMMVNSDTSQQKLSRLTIFVVSGQMVMAVQAMSAISHLSIHWIEPVRSIFQAMKLLTFDFDILRLSCIFHSDNPVLMFTVQLIAYPGFVIAIFFTWLSAKFMGKKLPINALFNLNGILLFMLFITLTLTVLMPFQCGPNPNRTTSMSSNPGITCWESPEHWLLAAMAVVGTLAYPVAIISWAAWTVLKYPSRIQSGRGVRLVHRHRFFFHRFTAKRFYYGLVLLLRNAAVALIPVVLVTLPVLQVAAMGVVLLVGAALQCRLWPWRTKAANVADLASNFFLLVFLLGAAPLVDASTQDSEQLLGGLLVLAIVGSLGMGVIAAVHSFIRQLRPETSFGAFLCHHKQGAGSLCRYLKLLIAKHSHSMVFIDSDHLQDLDLLFDTVRCNCKNLVVILTPELLKRMWCAGEIVTAHRNGINIVPVFCDGFTPPNENALQLVEKLWTEEEKHLLCTYGITMEHVEAAYRHLLSLKPLRLSRMAEERDLESFLLELLGSCRLPRKTFAGASEASGKPRILVAGNVADLEALATCQIVAHVIQSRQQVEAAVMRDPAQVERALPHASFLVVVLTRGMLREPGFARVVLAAANAGLEPLLVNADVGFEFPNTDFYHEMASTGIDAPGLGPEVGPALAEAYQALFNVLALPLTPHGSDRLIQEQLLQVCLRFSMRKTSRASGNAPYGETVVALHSSSSQCRKTLSIQSTLSSRSSPAQCCRRGELGEPTVLEEPEETSGTVEEQMENGEGRLRQGQQSQQPPHASCSSSSRSTS